MQQLRFRCDSPERMKLIWREQKRLHLQSCVYGRFFSLISSYTHKTHARLHISNAESQLRFLFHLIPYNNLNKCSHEVKTHAQNSVVEWFYSASFYCCPFLFRFGCVSCDNFAINKMFIYYMHCTSQTKYKKLHCVMCCIVG